jgi:uncharacterized protein YfaS (alpha-2-macroglobulin family)
MLYQLGETVICSVEVRNAAGTLVDPATSMKITITDNKNGTEVDDQAMTKDETGKYHYDWQTNTITAGGVYYILYTATNGTRISIMRDSVEVH